MISLALFVYGAAALALDTTIVNKPPHRADLVFFTSREKVMECKIHGTSRNCHKTEVSIAPNEGFK